MSCLYRHLQTMLPISRTRPARRRHRADSRYTARPPSHACRSVTAECPRSGGSLSHTSHTLDPAPRSRVGVGCRGRAGADEAEAGYGAGFDLVSRADFGEAQACNRRKPTSTVARKYRSVALLPRTGSTPVPAMSTGATDPVQTVSECSGRRRPAEGIDRVHDVVPGAALHQVSAGHSSSDSYRLQGRTAEVVAALVVPLVVCMISDGRARR